MGRPVSLFLLLVLFQIVNSIRRVPPDVANFQHSEYSSSEEFIYEAFNASSIHSRRLKTKDGHEVKSLPSFSGKLPVNFAGHLFVEGDHSALFYWLFEAASNPSTAPLIIWMNGGPGCSSMDGLFLELGPFRLNNGEVVMNPHSWHNAANIMFIDQPVGTGLAYTKKSKYPRNDEELSVHFYRMLQEFFRLHDNYLLPSSDSRGKQMMTRKVFITGESHAGHYIPVFTKYIMDKNARASGKEDLVIDIGGLAIGNGWMDPYNQYDVSEFMHSLGALSLGQKYTMKEKERTCRALLKKGNLNSQKCFSLMDEVLATTGSSATGRMVMYDARELSKGSRPYPPGHEEVEKYLNRKDVRSALHASETPQAFKECTDPPYNALAHQDGKGVTNELAFVLDSKIPVLLFSGQFDVICNHLGTEKLLNRLKWSGREAWLKASTVPWAPMGVSKGFVRQALNLQNLVVSNAGHMVPLSKPAESLDMIRKFITGQPLRLSASFPVIPSTIPPQAALGDDGRALLERSLSSEMENVGRASGELSAGSKEGREYFLEKYCADKDPADSSGAASFLRVQSGLKTFPCQMNIHIELAPATYPVVHRDTAPLTVSLTDEYTDHLSQLIRHDFIAALRRIGVDQDDLVVIRNLYAEFTTKDSSEYRGDTEEDSYRSGDLHVEIAIKGPLVSFGAMYWLYDCLASESKKMSLFRGGLIMTERSVVDIDIV